jgi:hypothetical protein
MEESVNVKRKCYGFTFTGNGNSEMSLMLMIVLSGGGKIVDMFGRS